jgi:hypothetical protein
VVGVGLGVLQRYEVRRRRVTHGRSYTYGSPPPVMVRGSYNYTTHTDTYEQFTEEELTRLPLGTGLVPLLQFRWVTGGWTATTSRHGTCSSTTSTTHADGHWRVRAFHFPPAYLPIWLDPLVRAGSARRGSSPER